MTGVQTCALPIYVGFTLLDRGTGIISTLDKWVDGWTAGAGIEYMLVDRISLGVTWDYTDLSASGVGMSCTSCGFGVGLGTPVVDTHIRINAVMARLTVRFGGMCIKSADIGMML